MFAKLREKHLSESLFFNKVADMGCSFIKKGIPNRGKSTYTIEDLRAVNCRDQLRKDSRIFPWNVSTKFFLLLEFCLSSDLWQE